MKKILSLILIFLLFGTTIAYAYTEAPNYYSRSSPFNLLALKFVFANFFALWLMPPLPKKFNLTVFFGGPIKMVPCCLKIIRDNLQASLFFAHTNWCVIWLTSVIILNYFLFVNWYFAVIKHKGLCWVGVDYLIFCC